MYESEKSNSSDEEPKHPDIFSTSRKRFSPEEDAKLKALVSDVKLNRWEQIATQMPGRTARQCRDRYNNYLYKVISDAPWTSEEDNMIIKKFKEIGPRWSEISKHLKGRSGNNVKNRWYKYLKKRFGTNVTQEVKKPRLNFPPPEYSFDSLIETFSPNLDNKFYSEFEFLDFN